MNLSPALPLYALMASAAKHNHSAGIRLLAMAKEFPERAHLYQAEGEWKMAVGREQLIAARQDKERFA